MSFIVSQCMPLRFLLSDDETSCINLSRIHSASCLAHGYLWDVWALFSMLQHEFHGNDQCFLCAEHRLEPVSGVSCSLVFSMRTLFSPTP